MFERMPNLKVLYLQGNPVVKRIRNYRKTLISRLKQLRFMPRHYAGSGVSHTNL